MAESVDYCGATTRHAGEQPHADALGANFNAELAH